MIAAHVLKYNPYHDPKSGRFTFKKGLGAGRLGSDWIGHTGKKLPQHVLDKIKKFRVPPAWKDVQVNPNDTDALQVVGVDVKGRVQYLYSREHSEQSAAEKYQRLKDFHAVIPSINRKVINVLKDETQSTLRRDSAAITRLIEKTGFRVGSNVETFASVKAYGASTLRKEHVSIDGDTMSFDFVGKKGIRQQRVLKDKILADYLRTKTGDQLFNVNDTSLRAFFKEVAGDDFSFKDYRTWHGTSIAMKELGKYETPSTKREAQSIKKAVLDKVSKFLGNTPTVAMTSYVDPSVWAPIEPFLLKKKAA